jgi:hypothetical protein
MRQYVSAIQARVPLWMKCVCVLFASVKWRVELAPMVTSTAHDGHCVKRHTSKRYVMAIGLKSSQRVRVEW